MATQDESFGEKLRRLREAAGLTQEALAEAAGLSASAVAVLERGERRRPYPHTVRVLADALRLSPEDRATFLSSVPARSAAPPVIPSRPDLPVVAPPGFAAPTTRFIGRDEDLAAIGGLLRGGSRLVTLTGPGGVGKTRLSLQVAAETGDLFTDGAAFVSLAPLADPRLVVPTIARALGLRESGGEPAGDALRAHLRGRRVLLVLDNFEHLVAASGEIADLLATCPGVAVLATSRSPLRLRGEREYPVSPLGVPDLALVPTPDEVMRTPSVQLFLERAREVSPGFEVTRSNAAVVAAICRRLEGLPLALELAAPRLRLLSPTTLLARLDQALPLLTGGARDLPERQRTMRAAIEWSYQLLDEPERHLLDRLAVFRGGWDLAAAEAVGAGGAIVEGAVLDFLDRLVEQSLVMAGPGLEQESRYRLLMPIREYVEERLSRGSEAEPARRAHAAWYLALAERAGREMWSERHGAWPARLEVEYDNVRAALHWAVGQGEVETGLRLTYALWKFTRSQGHVSEMGRWQEQLLSVGGAVAPGVRVRALWLAGDLAGLAGDYRGAGALLEESLARARESGDAAGIARALYLLGNVAEDLGEVARETAYYEEALALFRAVGERWWIPETMAGLGRAARKRGDFARANELHEQALALQRDAGNIWGVAWGTTALAELAADERRLAPAAALFAEGLRLHAKHGEQMGVMYCLLGLGKLAAAHGRADAAALILGAAEALREARGLSLPQDHRAPHDACVALVRADLGDARFAALWMEGGELPLARVVPQAEALAGSVSSASAPASLPGSAKGDHQASR